MRVKRCTIKSSDINSSSCPDIVRMTFISWVCPCTEWGTSCIPERYTHMQVNKQIYASWDLAALHKISCLASRSTMKSNEFPSKTIIIYTHLLVGGSALISMPVQLGQAAGGTCSQDHTQASKRIHRKCRLKGVIGWRNSVRVPPLLDKKSWSVQWETNMKKMSLLIDFGD